MVAEKVVREGVYKEYEVDVAPQQYDDARSTFKAAKETKSKKGECALCCLARDQTDATYFSSLRLLLHHIAF